jgi:hypothetical protein
VHIKKTFLIPQLVLYVAAADCLFSQEPISLVLSDARYSEMLRSDTNHSSVFLERTIDTFENRAGKLFQDRFRLVQIFRVEQFKDAVEIIEAYDEKAIGLLNKSAIYTFREVAEGSQFFIWAEENWDGFGTFLKNSLGNVDEEEIGSARIGRSGEQSWLAKAASSRLVQYGFRPFNASPYLYAGKRITYHGSLLGIFHVRYRWDWYKVSDPRVELAFYVPIYKGVMVSATYARPIEGENDKTTLRFHYRFRGGGELAAGTFLRNDLNCLVTYSVPWGK